MNRGGKTYYIWMLEGNSSEDQRVISDHFDNHYFLSKWDYTCFIRDGRGRIVAVNPISRSKDEAEYYLGKDAEIIVPQVVRLDPQPQLQPQNLLLLI